MHCTANSGHDIRAFCAPEIASQRKSTESGMQPHVKARTQDRPTTVRGMTLVNFVCCTTVSLKLAAGLVWCGLVCPCLVWSGLVWSLRVRAWSCARVRVCSRQPLHRELPLPNGSTYAIENSVLASQASAQTHGQRMKHPHVTRLSRWLPQHPTGGARAQGPGTVPERSLGADAGP